jgi:hypothetical protein|nr:MAG TPA: homing endonuclease [Caudoviricetes sp.]DAM24317.1 MAG TPA: homing endonuclease [Caudoviricetes sp.]
MVEIWKDIKGYEGLYQVSNLGRVKSLSIYRKNSVCEYYSKEKILKPLKDKGGYLNVRLWKNKKGKTIKIHRLVACNFLENTENKRDVNHINGIKTDNRVSNLEWATRSENIQHAFKNNLNKPHSSSEKQKKIVRERLGHKIKCTNNNKIYVSIREAGRELDLTPSSIIKVLNKKIKQTKGYSFEYIENTKV